MLALDQSKSPNLALQSAFAPVATSENSETKIDYIKKFLNDFI